MGNKFPNHWLIKTIDELASNIESGFSCNKSFEKENGYVHLRTHNIGLNGKLDFSTIIRIDESKVDYRKCKLIKGDVLFNNTNSKELVGKTAYIESDYNYGYSNHLTKIQVSSEVLPSFLVHYFLKLRKQGYFQEICNKWIGQAGINTTALKQIQIPLPPLPEQHRIVAKLDSLFERIDKAIALVEQNITHARHLMASLLNEVFGKLDCERKIIADLVIRTRQINPNANPDSQFTYIDISAIDNENHKIANPNSFVGKDTPSRARKEITKDDILFATTRPNLKNVAIISENYMNPVASTGFCVLRADQSKIDTGYLFLFLISNKTQEQIAPFIRGAQYPAISDSDLLNCSIPLPPISEQKRIEQYISSVLKKQRNMISRYTERYDELKALKSSLLDAAFKGEL